MSGSVFTGPVPSVFINPVSSSVFTGGSLGAVPSGCEGDCENVAAASPSFIGWLHWTFVQREAAGGCFSTSDGGREPFVSSVLGTGEDGEGIGEGEAFEGASLGLSEMAVHLGTSLAEEVGGFVDDVVGSGVVVFSSFFFGFMGINPGSYISPKPTAVVFLRSLKERVSSSGGASAGRLIVASPAFPTISPVPALISTSGLTSSSWASNGGGAGVDSTICHSPTKPWDFRSSSFSASGSVKPSCAAVV